MEQHRTEGGSAPLWSVVVVALAGLAIIAVAAAIGMAAVWHDELIAADLLLPGSAIADVDLSGAPAAHAREVAEAAGAEALARTVVISHGEERWELRPSDIGGFADVETAVSAVVGTTRDATPLRAGLARWFGVGGKAVPVRTSVDDDALEAFLDGVVAGIDRDPRDATITWGPEGVELVTHQTGQRTDRPAAIEAIRAALAGGGPLEVALAVAEAPHRVATEVVEPVVELVASAVDHALDRPITMSAGEREWVVTGRELGAVPDLQPLVDEAVAAWPPATPGGDGQAAEAAERADAGDAAGQTLAVQAADRPTSDELADAREVVLTVTPSIHVAEEALARFVAGLAEEVDVPVRDAGLNLADGWVELVGEQTGRLVDREAATAALAAALTDGGERVELPIATAEPAVTREAYAHVLLVRQDQRRLYLFADGEVVREWPIAIGAAGNGTPRGIFTVGAKRHLPTWTNPSPSGWGASMPAQIGPGPNNPLGLRALNWLKDGNDTLIRFHGTSNLGSIGSAASKGCIRLRNSDVVELYDLVPTGTTIVSTWG
jgi:lipoprotein-anchoring transpeptidase ErfK/SrfK